MFVFVADICAFRRSGGEENLDFGCASDSLVLVQKAAGQGSGVLSERAEKRLSVERGWGWRA
jgi:hypothetical protein